MNSLYNLAGRQISVIRADISTYSADPIGGATRRTHITSALSALIKTIEDYEAMAKRELVVAKREKALARVANLHQEVRQLGAFPRRCGANSTYTLGSYGAQYPTHRNYSSGAGH